ncbi:MAG: carbohydrate kinase, partial [Bacteroidetes bacterium]|nr:carbohydrate kinase [Bacteroidota bacterium]
MPPPLDILSVGELLVDLIGEAPAEALADTTVFRKQPGGSAANLACNAARLGGAVALVAAVGDDTLGPWLQAHVEATGVDVTAVATVAQVPTTAVLVARTTGTPDFTAYRGADAELQPEHLPNTLCKRPRIFHTTCFALSRAPARATILAAAVVAAQHGATLSIDANYAPAIGPDRAAAQYTVQRYCQHSALVKLSADDVARLFGGSTTLADAIATVHSWGAPLVCVTRGPQGARISWEGGKHATDVPAAPVTIRGEATGAGDAFWAGFLMAHLTGQAPVDCAAAGSRMAARTLST